jgi:hypothetical protein
MEQWQIDALVKLLSVDAENKGIATELSETRVYLQSPYYGESRYHVVTLHPDGDIVIDQVDGSEKYQQRVSLETQEVAPLVRTLISWYLRAVEQQEQAPNDGLGEYSVNDIDEHPF